MAKIPEFGGLQLNGTKTGLPSNLITASSGLHHLGDGINALADLMLQKKKEDDQLQYQKALLDLDAFGSDELNNPETGYKNLQGENALSESENYNQRYTDKITEIRESLKGNSFLNRFDLQTQDMQTAYSRQLMTHESQQQSALALKTAQSSIDLALSNAQTLYNDPTSLAMGFDNLVSRIDEFSEHQGMSAEVRQLQKDQLKQQYYSSALDGWIANTELKKGDFNTLSVNIKKSMAYNQLTEINQAKYLLKLDSLTKRQGNEYRDKLSLDLTNAWAMQQRGIEAKSIPLSAFNSVYGEKGKQAYDAYQDRQIMARNIHAMQNMPTDKLVQYTKESISNDDKQYEDKLTADTKNPNFADRLKLQNIRSQAAINVIKSRNSDPIAAAAQSGEIGELDLSATGLTERINQAERVSEDYKTPLKIFSNNEALQISKSIEGASAAQQAELLQVLAKASGDNSRAYNSMLNDIGMQNPAFAAAGNIMNSDGGKYVTVNKNLIFSDDTVDKQTTAQFILKGAEALKGTGKGEGKINGIPLPPKSLEEFDKVAGDLFLNDPSSKQAVYAAAMSYYTGKSVSNGTYSNSHDLNIDLLKESVNAVTGYKSDKYNVRMPWGMSENRFKKRVEARYKEIADSNNWSFTDNYNPQDPYRLSKDGIDRFTLIPSTYPSGLPDGKYFLKAGNGFLRDNNGNPVVIDVFKSRRVAEDIPE